MKGLLVIVFLSAILTVGCATARHIDYCHPEDTMTIEPSYDENKLTVKCDGMLPQTKRHTILGDDVPCKEGTRMIIHILEDDNPTYRIECRKEG